MVSQIDNVLNAYSCNSILPRCLEGNEQAFAIVQALAIFCFYLSLLSFHPLQLPRHPRLPLRNQM
ncbi:hypothetical protein BT96DRAFT_917502, partial [Gymnopus androsaceus JB14]